MCNCVRAEREGGCKEDALSLPVAVQDIQAAAAVGAGGEFRFSCVVRSITQALSIPECHIPLAN